MWANAANRDVINMFVDLGTAILNIINEVGGLQSAFALLYGGTILKGLMTADSLLVKFITRLDEAKASSKTLGDVFDTIFGSNKSDSENKSIFKGWEQIQDQRDKRAKAKDNPETEALEKQKEAQEEMNDILEEANGIKEESIKVSEEKTAAEIAETTAETAGNSAKTKGAVDETIDATATEANTKKTEENTGATLENKAAEDAQSASKVAGAASQGMDGGATGLAAFASSPAAWLMAIPAVLALISTIIGSIKKQQQELIDSEKEAASTWQEAKTGIDEYAQKYQELHTQLQNTNLSEEEQADIKKQIYELQKQITEEYGNAADGVNLINGNLDEQLEKLRQIKAEEAKKNLLDNEKEYENAQKAMEQERSYDMVVARNAPVTQDAQDILKKYGYELKQRSAGMGAVEQYIEFKGDASDAEQALKDLYNEVGEFSEDERVSKGLNTFFDSISAAIEQNNQVLRDHQEAYNAFLEAKIFDNDNLYGDAQKTAGEVLIQLEDAVNDYNIALQSGDTSQIEEAQKTFESLKGTVQDITKDMGEVYARPFDDIIDNVNQTAETIYNFQKKMNDPKVHSMAESVFGDLAENKKISKETQDEVLDAAGVVLNMQRELTKEGLTGILSPLYEDIDTKHTTRFGNVDLMNRPVLKWDDTARQKYGKAWASWNTDAQGNVKPMYDDGTISTVLGTWDDKFGANKDISIAFTPLLNTGSELELLDADTVYNYINDLIEQATDESGKLDTNKLFTLDADPKSGKNLIAAVGKTSEKVASVMHYLGKDGAYTTAMANLKKAAEQANIPVEKIIASMRNLGNRSGIREMFTDTLPSVEEVKMALADTTGQFQDLQDFAEQNFNITAETPDAEIEGFIEAMQIAGLVATTTTEESQKSLDDFYADVSNKINKISELASISSKGLSQGGLSFTKMLDEDKKVVESDVSKIVDSFQHIYDLDVGSLFEETATGIKLNMDAYRQLVQQEESATKLQFANKRKELKSDLTLAQMQGASTSEINKIKQQIIDLDMLASAYDGATSATAKYLAQQNASDYGDAYKMFRDTTVKRADELMSEGMIGTEEFRTIAQLFSYDSLATASADKVLEAYQKGYENVKKYLTEDTTTGMQTFLDDLVALPEEYGKFIKNADGGYMLEFTDAQEDMLAKHLGVSKDMLESFYDMLNAQGFDIHFFRDGTLDEFDKLNENIHASQDRLKELKETANDKELIPDSVFDVNPDELNTVEELQKYLNELSKIKIDPEVNPEEYEAWKTLLEQIQQKIDVLNSTTQNEDGSISIGDFKQADEQVKYFKENFEETIASLKEKGTNPITIKTAIENDEKIREFGEMLASWPPEMQTYIAASLGINGFQPTNDPEQITQQLFGHLEEGIEIPAEVSFYGAGHKPIGADSITPEDLEMEVGVKPPTQEQVQEAVPDGVDIPATPVLKDPSTIQNGIDSVPVGVKADPASIESAKQETTDGISSAEPEVGVKTKLTSAEDLEPLATLASNGDIHLNLDADASQAQDVIEETKEEAEEPVETGVHFNPDNTVQDAANQAGAQQGVQTTTTENKVTNEEIHTTATADTSQVDTAAQSVSGLQAMNGTTVAVGLSVVGTENIDIAKANVDDLIQKDKSKVTVTLIGNTALFNKAYLQANSALNTLAQKKTEPKISADNSSLKDKVSEAKSKLNSIDNKKVHITATNSGFGEISNWKHNTYDGLHDKSIKVTTHYSYTGDPKMGKGGFQGSAHSQGTIVSNGHAYAGGTLSGNWGLPKAEKGALINELGSEIIVTPDGHWQILNSGDPTFANLPKGAIIFNHKQTESLLKKGYVNGSHGKMVGGAFANGTIDDEDFDEEELEGSAYAIGTTGWNGQLSGMSHAASGGGNLGGAKKAKKGSSSSGNKSSGSGKKGSSGSGKKKSSGSNSSSKKAKDTLQTLDAIEIRLNRIDALISQLDATAAKTYETFAGRNSALTQDLETVQKEINAINSSLKSTSSTYNYLAKASSAAKEAGLQSGDEGYKKGAAGSSGTALSSTWIKRIQNSVNNGTYMTLNDVKDEGLWKKIQAYQTWYEKYVKLQQKAQEQTAKLSQLTIQQLTLIQTKWEATLNTISANITSLQNRADLLTEQGYDVAESLYTSQITQNQKRIDSLTQEANELQKQLDDAVKTGRIKQYSEEWYKWYNQIKNINNEIIATNKEIQTLNNSIRQLKWDKFDRARDRVSDLVSEMDFLNNLVYENDLFTEKGAMTDRGRAAMGLIGMQYDELVRQAERYKEAVLGLNEEIAKDPNNKTLIEQRDTWLKAQQDAISGAREQKEAMADLIEKGIKKQIEAMEELIDKYEDALTAEKEQVKYAEDIAEKQKQINSLEKQLRSMEGDDSEEGKTRRQKLRDELKEAQKDLADLQEEQRISDIQDTLSNMQEKYEEVLNARLDNIDQLFAENVTAINLNGSSIVNEIKALASSVNYNFSSLLDSIVSNSRIKDNASNNGNDALVSGTDDTNGTLNNTSAATLADRWIKSGNNWYLTNESGEKYTGWQKNDGKWYYMDSNGTMTTGWQKVNNKWYYMDKSGAMTTGWQQVGGKWYHMDKSGAMETGWKKIDDKWYYMDSNGAMQTGWQKVNNKWYLLNRSGAMMTGWQKSGNQWYHLDSSGAMETGWKKIDNKWYYLGTNGAMQTGWQKLDNKWYFLNSSGVMLTGEHQIGKDSYYLGSDGAMRTGTFNADGYKYITDDQGRIKSKVKGKLAKGTASVKQSGLYQVDEEGNEIFINKQGKIYTRLEKGATVLPHDAAINLLKGMSNPAEFIASHMDMRPNKNITNTNTTNGDTVNYITFKMDGVTNYAEFMREAQRDPNFTKYIQEISIGKLNGNNSLKGNSIRFK